MLYNSLICSKYTKNKSGLANSGASFRVNNSGSEICVIHHLVSNFKFFDGFNPSNFMKTGKPVQADYHPSKTSFAHQNYYCIKPCRCSWHTTLIQGILTLQWQTAYGDDAAIWRYRKTTTLPRRLFRLIWFPSSLYRQTSVSPRDSRRLYASPRITAWWSPVAQTVTSGCGR